MPKAPLKLVALGITAVINEIECREISVRSEVEGKAEVALKFGL